MAKKDDSSLVVGLDIGTSKIVAIVGEYLPGEQVEVIGIGSHPSRGLKRGVVVQLATPNTVFGTDLEIPSTLDVPVSWHSFKYGNELIQVRFDADTEAGFGLPEEQEDAEGGTAEGELVLF